MEEAKLNSIEVQELKLCAGLIANKKNELMLLEKGQAGLVVELIKKYNLDTSSVYRLEGDTLRGIDESKISGKSKTKSRKQKDN